VFEKFSSKRLLKLLAGAEASTGLPVGTTKAIDLAFGLSAQMEEGRPLRFGFLLADHSEYRPELSLGSRVVDPDAIRRLVLAADATEHVWRVELHKGRISVSGLARYPFDLDPSIVTDVLIEGRGPLSLRVTTGGTPVRYARGKHFVADGSAVLQTLVPGVCTDSVAAFCSEVNGDRTRMRWDMASSEVITSTYDAHQSAVSTVFRETATRAVVGALLTGIEHMLALGHGGSIIVSGSDSADESFIKKHSLEPRKSGSFSSPGHSRALTSFTMAMAHWRLAKGGIILLKELKDAMARDSERDIDDILGVHRRGSYAAQYARAWARLSFVDGIVVLSPMLEPRLFGAISQLPQDFKGAKKLQDKGARHRSVAYAVTQMPGSLGICVSQDGGVTAFTSQGDPIPLLL
jgi:hypothetical protein